MRPEIHRRILRKAGGELGLRSEAKRLKTLENENAKLKRLLAEQMLDLAAMKELVSKKSGYEPGQKTVRGTVFPAIGLP